jgi:hypothetical protein
MTRRHAQQAIERYIRNANDNSIYVKMKGVWFSKSPASWVATWRQNGKRKTKSFRVSKYGYDQARQLAEEVRQQHERDETRQDKTTPYDRAALINVKDGNEHSSTSIKATHT